jgi:hypothetical protein
MHLDGERRSLRGGLGVVDPAARALDITAAPLLVEAPLNGLAARPARDSRLPFGKDRVHQVAQPLESGFPVSGLGPVLP